MAQQYEIQGLSEVEEALKELPAELQARIYRALNTKAVKKFVVEPIRSAWRTSEKTVKGITVVTDKDDPTAVYGGVTASAYHLRFADRGTAERYTEKGSYRGQIVGRNKIQPIILNSADDIIKYMNDELGKEVQKILKRYIKSTEKKIAAL